MAATKTPVLRCQHLGIQFGGLKAVDDFNLEIGESELVGLIGPNGAGKTTVFNLITGVYKPTEGSFYLNGVQMNGKRPIRSFTRASPAPSRTSGCSRR